MEVRCADVECIVRCGRLCSWFPMAQNFVDSCFVLCTMVNTVASCCVQWWIQLRCVMYNGGYSCVVLFTMVNTAVYNVVYSCTAHSCKRVEGC